jgi:hypothetical protein
LDLGANIFLASAISAPAGHFCGALSLGMTFSKFQA